MQYFTCFNLRKRRSTPLKGSVADAKRGSGNSTDEECGEHLRVRHNSILKWIRANSTSIGSTSEGIRDIAEPRSKSRLSNITQFRERKRLQETNDAKIKKPSPPLEINKNVLVQFTYMPFPMIHKQMDSTSLPNYLNENNSTCEEPLTSDSSDKSLALNTNAVQRLQAIRPTDSNASFGSGMRLSKTQSNTYPYSPPSHYELPFALTYDDPEEIDAKSRPYGTEPHDADARESLSSKSDHEGVFILPYSKSTHILLFADDLMSTTPTFVMIAAGKENEPSSPVQGLPQKLSNWDSCKYPFLPTSPTECKLPFKVEITASTTDI